RRECVAVQVAPISDGVAGDDNNVLEPVAVEILQHGVFDSGLLEASERDLDGGLPAPEAEVQLIAEGRVAAIGNQLHGVEQTVRVHVGQMQLIDVELSAER